MTTKAPTYECVTAYIPIKKGKTFEGKIALLADTLGFDTNDMHPTLARFITEGRKNLHMDNVNAFERALSATLERTHPERTGSLMDEAILYPEDTPEAFQKPLIRLCTVNQEDTYIYVRIPMNNAKATGTNRNMFHWRRLLHNRLLVTRGEMFDIPSNEPFAFTPEAIAEAVNNV